MNTRFLVSLCAIGVALTTCHMSVARGQSASRAQPLAMKKSRLPEALTTKPVGSPFDVVPVDRSTRTAAKEAAARIDELLEARQRAAGVDPGEPLDDAGFVRRAYLELGGRIPTCEESLRFFATKDPDRRAALIDAILESPDYVSRLYCVWAETLRLAEDNSKLYFEPYLDWVKRSIAMNRPYDAWVREMITANGKLWVNPAVGYQLRDAGMPLPYVDSTVRVFLGTRIGCAQCHDHPTEPWTQRQFYELAAFTYGDPAGRGVKRPELEAVRLLRKDLAAIQGDTGVYPAHFFENNATIVAYRPKPLRLPDGRSQDPDAAESLRPRVLWGDVEPLAEGADGREVFAEWMTSRGNRQFARTIANRLWRLFMGVGIVEPIDDFSDSNPPSHPELLEHLTDEMLRLDFDVREFIRIVVNTRAWQNRAEPYDPTSGEVFTFAGPALRRMTAEQLWDSVLTLAVHDIWRHQRATIETVAAGVDLDLSSGHVDVDEARQAFLKHLSVPVYPMGRGKDVLRAYRFGRYDFVRASELRAPLPLSHPLRIFGQSERETVDGGRTSGTLMQVLLLLNNTWFPGIATEPGTVLEKTISGRPPRERVDAAFMSILTRMPDTEERAMAEEMISRAKTPWQGIQNLIAALLMTREFMFIQ